MDTKVNGYAENNYADFFKGLVIVYQPKELIEIGIGRGYTLDAILCGVKYNGFGRIKAYDIFEKWPYHSQPNYEEIVKKYKHHKEVKIIKDDFFNLYRILDSNSIDFINIDIAMDGDKYEFFFRLIRRAFEIRFWLSIIVI